MSTPEQKLKRIMSNLEWNCVRKEWSRRTRSKSVTGYYSEILVAVKELLKVIQLVLKCYTKYPKVYKRLGPKSKKGGLDQFLTEVTDFQTFLEDSFYHHLRTLLPLQMPNEILKMIWEFSQTGTRRFDFGFYSKSNLDQVCESIQRKKFLILTRTLTINLINCILMIKMDSRGQTIETLMQYFVQDAAAFKDLNEENMVLEKSQFSKFTPQVPLKKCSAQITNYLNSSSCRKPPSPVKKTWEHDYALSPYMM